MHLINQKWEVSFQMRKNLHKRLIQTRLYDMILKLFIFVLQNYLLTRYNFSVTLTRFIIFKTKSIPWGMVCICSKMRRVKQLQKEYRCVWLWFRTGLTGRLSSYQKFICSSWQKQPKITFLELANCDGREQM